MLVDYGKTYQVREGESLEGVAHSPGDIRCLAGSPALLLQDGELLKHTDAKLA